MTTDLIRPSLAAMTCPDCRGTGVISRPYIAGVGNSVSPCDCQKGKDFMAEWDRQSAEQRARQMNAELPEDQRAMLKTKGMIR